MRRTLAADWNAGLFVGCFCVIASMYGGGFATIPAYLADMFGTQFVGAIHGRLLTAWSTAGIVGPVIVNYLHDTAKAEGLHLTNSTGRFSTRLQGCSSSASSPTF